MNAEGAHSCGSAWGLKEPNALLFLPDFGRKVGDLHYVHLVRHGGDMALSDNQIELDLWGRDLGASGLAPVRDSLLVWRRLNDFAVEAAQREFPGRHLILRYEDLCRDPMDVIRVLFEFLELDADPAGYATNIRPASGLGRHEGLAQSMYSPEDRATLVSLGYVQPG